MSLYDRFACRPGGERALAAARLRYRALSLLQKAVLEAGEIRLPRGTRKALYGDGDVSVTQLAEILHACGYEVELTLVPAGEPRSKALEDAAGPGSCPAPEAPM